MLQQLESFDYPWLFDYQGGLASWKLTEVCLPLFLYRISLGCCGRFTSAEIMSLCCSACLVLVWIVTGHWVLMDGMSESSYTEFIKMAGAPKRGILGLTEYLFTDFFLPKNTVLTERNRRNSITANHAIHATTNRRHVVWYPNNKYASTPCCR